MGGTLCVWSVFVRGERCGKNNNGKRNWQNWTVKCLLYVHVVAGCADVVERICIRGQAKTFPFLCFRESCPMATVSVYKPSQSAHHHINSHHIPPLTQFITPTLHFPNTHIALQHFHFPLWIRASNSLKTDFIQLQQNKVIASSHFVSNQTFCLPPHPLLQPASFRTPRKP